MLLEAYALWKIGQIALWAAIVSFVMAAVMLARTAVRREDLRLCPALADRADDRRRIHPRRP